jgi:hypothetical protein
MKKIGYKKQRDQKCLAKVSQHFLVGTFLEIQKELFFARREDVWWRMILISSLDH